MLRNIETAAPRFGPGEALIRRKELALDIASLLGLVFGIAVVLGAILYDSSLVIFINVPGILIVFGGTAAATLIKFPLQGLLAAIPVGLRTVFAHDKEKPRDYIEQAIVMSKRARKAGLVSLDSPKVRNPFFRKGVQLCADGRELDYIRSVLTREMATSIQQEELGARVFNAIGESAPAFGMFGTLVGLVQMLANLENPDSIGPAMAVAMLTTLYGVLIANLVALPIADKLETKIETQKQLRSLIIECVFQIQQMQNPMAMREILETHLPEKRRPSGTKSYTAAKGGNEGGQPRRKRSGQ